MKCWLLISAPLTPGGAKEQVAHPEARLFEKAGLLRSPVGSSILASAFALAVASAAWAAVPERVDFNFQVKPILSDRCYHCHGPDQRNRQADLRLDTKEGLFKVLDAGEGRQVVKPGSAEHSEMFRRISSTDEDVRMPPPDSKLSVSDEEITVLRRWIEQGAEWKPHWSLIPLHDVAVPNVKRPDGVRNEIDRFVLARLERDGLTPATEASRERLIRRLSFDLTGLPPTLQEIDAFLGDASADAYEHLADRLLNSERFGERMAVDWLDVARYADTYGYQADVSRAVWPYRDWVIRAFNANLPYDQFIVWQLAGDLLPNPTRDQQIATAFNRMHRQTNEGGSIEEEFRVDYVSDRTNTLGAAFLGLTLECARCHEHKYDPISQQDYYRLFGFFNNLDECGLYSHFTDAMPNPTLLLATDEQQQRIDGLKQQIQQAEQQLAALAETRRPDFDRWLADRPREATIRGLVGDYPLESIQGGKLDNRAAADKPAKVFEDPQVVPGHVGNGLQLSGENNVTTPVGGDWGRNQPFSIALWINTPDHKDRAVILHRSRAWTDAGSRGYELLLEDGCLSAALIHFWPGNAIRIRTKTPAPIGQWTHVVMAYDGSSRAAGFRLYVNGRQAECEIVRDNLFKEITGGGANELTLGQRFRDRGFKNGLVDELQLYDRCLTPIEAQQVYDGKSLAEALSSPADQLTADQKQSLFAYYLTNFDQPYRDAAAAVTKLRNDRSAAVDPIPELMVMNEMPEPRPTFLLKRGAYDAPGEQVQPGVPASILPWSEAWPQNRLGLARWLTDPKHPLTARVAVNRFWQLLFGRGLVPTPEDLREPGPAAVGSRAVGLAGQVVYRLRLGCQRIAQTDRHVGHLSTGFGGGAGVVCSRSGQRAVGPRTALPLAGRNDSRQRLVFQRTARAARGRTARQALPAGRAVGREIGGQIRSRHGRRQSPSQLVHVLEANVAAARDGHPGCCQTRGMRGQAGDDVDPVTGARAAERPAVCRSRSGAGRAGTGRGRAATGRPPGIHFPHAHQPAAQRTGNADFEAIVRGTTPGLHGSTGCGPAVPRCGRPQAQRKIGRRGFGHAGGRGAGGDEL